MGRSGVYKEAKYQLDLSETMRQLEFRLDDDLWTKGSPIAIPRVYELLNQSVLNGGKHLRPYLSLVLSDALGLDGETAKTIAVAAERVHAATLAHDDVIDHGSLRRGRPTLRMMVGNGKAILAGDMLLARVVSDVASMGCPPLSMELALCLENLVSGEWLQLESRGRTDASSTLLYRITDLKTGALLRWPLVAPMQFSNFQSAASAEDVAILEELAKSMGRLFQLVDDIIDYRNTEKEPWSDLRDGLVNHVTWVMFQRFPESRPIVQKFFDHLSLPDSSVSDLPDLKHQWIDDAISHVHRTCEVFFESSRYELARWAERDSINRDIAYSQLNAILIKLKERKK